MFWMVACVAIYLGVMFGPGGTLADFIALCLNWIGLVAIAAGVIYARQSLQAFCIGCALFAVPTMIWTNFIWIGSVVGPNGSLTEMFVSYRRAMHLQHLVIVVSGLLMVGFRWLILRAQRRT
jgi:hypothetical protein